MNRRFRRKKTGGNYFKARGRKAKRFEKSVKKICREVIDDEPEILYKGTDIDIGTTYLGNSNVTLLTATEQGDDNVGDRTGDSIKLRSVQVRISCTDVGAANADGDILCRMMLVMMKNCDGVALAVTDVLDTDHPNEVRNWDERMNYTILKDKTFVLPKRDTVGHKSKRWISFYKKFHFMPKCTYQGGTAVVGDCMNNHLFLVLMTDAINTDEPNWLGHIRVTYTE